MTGAARPSPTIPELVDPCRKGDAGGRLRPQGIPAYPLSHSISFQREVTTEEPAQGFSFHFQGPTLRRLSAEEIRDSFVTLASGNIDSNTNNGLRGRLGRLRRNPSTS